MGCTPCSRSWWSGWGADTELAGVWERELEEVNAWLRELGMEEVAVGEGLVS